MRKFREIQSLMHYIDYPFQNPSLLQHALIHPSYANEQGEPKEASNQRLEFLGDAVLELCSSDFLFQRQPMMQEGVMTKMRAALVCEPTLADAARQIHLGDYIILGNGETREGIVLRDSVLSDAFEAVIAAIYLDGGLEQARRFILRFVLNDIENKQLFHDAKTMLQEYCAKHRIEESYEILREMGLDHQKIFEISVSLDGVPYGTGEGPSKKKAEQQAAYQALQRIRVDTGYVFKID